jgi:hypothetical protein
MGRGYALKVPTVVERPTEHAVYAFTAPETMPKEVVQDGAN